MTDTTPPTAEEFDKADKVALFGVVFELLRHEGNGIWERFNIFVGLNVALFAALGFVTLGNNHPLLWRGFGQAISCGGVVIGVCSLYVLGRLWERHDHWRRELQKIQSLFPKGWPRPIDGKEPKEDNEKQKKRVIFWNLTTWFVLVFLLAWVALLLMLVFWHSAFCPIR